MNYNSVFLRKKFFYLQNISWQKMFILVEYFLAHLIIDQKDIKYNNNSDLLNT